MTKRREINTYCTAERFFFSVEAEKKNAFAKKVIGGESIHS